MIAMSQYSGDNEVLNTINEEIQVGDLKKAKRMGKTLAPTDSQAVMGIAQSVNNTITRAVSKRIAAADKPVSTTKSTASVGKQYGRFGDSRRRYYATDVKNGFSRKDEALWIQGLYNHAKQDSSASTDGFSADTAGLVVGIDGKVNEDTTVGVGYAYTQTDADSIGRNMDVGGHNFFLYGSYKPRAWYVNAILSYGLNKYKEEKSPAGIAMKSKYDVNTYAANVMTGYEFGNGFTPEAGLRYILVDQKSYNDGLQDISNKDNNVLTAVMGMRYAPNNWTLKPTTRLALTYDILSSDSKSNVNIIDGGSYQITGKHLNPLGVETGVGIGTSINNWDFTVEYNGGFRKDFQTHSGILKAKHNF